LALVLSPVVGLFSAIAWFEAGGKDSGGIFGFVVGVVTFFLIVWKSRTVFRSLVAVMRSRLREPIASCIEFGVVGALVFGGVLLGLFCFSAIRAQSGGISTEFCL